jgi:peptide-methionine (S)-S-oxide reductase
MNKEIATLAGGCFWCTEAIFSRLKGVISITPGYAGGTTKNPTYEEVCTGKTGHAEAIQIKFDPSAISFSKLLDIFWHTHDPTTPNRQGNDVGPQYRSVIFYHNRHQKSEAEKAKAKLEKENYYSDPIVTEIIPFTEFYKAESYHSDYYNNNKDQPYCNFIIDPKIRKLINQYSEDLKPEYQQ